MDEILLDEQQIKKSNQRRRDLLPAWVKVFTWIFMVFGAFVPIVFILGIIGFNINISLYGLETMQPISLKGILIILLFGLKGVVAFGLWTEKEWAVNLAIIDAVIGIIICVFVMAVLPFIGSSYGTNISIRLELIPLLLYLLKMKKIKSDWAERMEFKN